jgi:putative salt-induced outer membrane protein YdiY
MGHPRSKLVINLLIIYLFFTSLIAEAGVLVLKNGDRITGSIERIWDDEIVIEPDYSDEFAVDLSVVDHLFSDQEFDIKLRDGRELLAKFSGPDEDGLQKISIDGESYSIALASIFELDEPEKEFDWESHVDLSTTFNSGNTNTSSVFLRADSTIKVPNHRHLLELSTSHESTENVTTKEQSLLRYNYNWFFNDPWFMSVQTSYERDPIIELESRIIASVGIGFDFWDTPRRTLSVQLGAGGQTEEISMASTDSSVATWTLRYRQGLLNDDLELFHNHTITSNIGGRTNTSYKTSTGVRYEITDLLYASLTFDYDYETNPPPDIENEDSTLLIGLGAEF